MAKKKNWIGILGLLDLLLKSESEKKWDKTWGKIDWRNNSEAYLLKKVAGLLEKNADVNAKDKKGRPVLMLLMEKGCEPAVFTLLEKGADANAKDKNNVTPLMLAVDGDEKNFYDMLIAKNADINARDKYGRSVLSWAVRAESKDLAFDLIERGADINVKDRDGVTPLMEAVILRNKDMGNKEGNDNNLIQRMIEKGADANAKDNDSATALDLAYGLNLIQDKELIGILKSAALIRSDYLAEHPAEQSLANMNALANVLFGRSRERS